MKILSIILFVLGAVIILPAFIGILYSFSNFKIVGFVARLIGFAIGVLLLGLAKKISKGAATR